MLITAPIGKVLPKRGRFGSEEEKMSLNRFGALVCCASNGVMKPTTVKKLVDILEKIGYNLLELCIDDLYRIDDEPFFGYMRGGYTHDEIKDLDAYCRLHGVELVPCIQTLSHLDNLVKLPVYADIVDIDNIMLVDEPKTYELIDKMFASIAADFTTRNVNIGFDEAQHVGLGKYLDKHGYVDRHELLLRHLNKVVEIAAKYGFNVHMWSDMFYRLSNHGEYSVLNPVLPQKVIDGVPDVELCYWDYYNTDEAMYDAMMTSHEQFGKPLWFTCAAWTSQGFSPLNHYAIKTIVPAMKQVAKHGIENVLVALWGDNGHDCSYFSALPVLYAAKQYADGNFDEESIKQGFAETFGLSYDDFMLLDAPNVTGDNVDYSKPYSSCKALLFSDPFLGWNDNAVANTFLPDYKQIAVEISLAGRRNKRYKYLFDNMVALCNALALKATLGVDTRKAYRENDRKALSELQKRYIKTAKAVRKFKETLQAVWFADNKPFGWEIHEIRLGGLISRLENCAARIKDYVQEKENAIQELDIDVLPYGANKVDCNVYKALVSVSQL